MKASASIAESTAAPAKKSQPDTHSSAVPGYLQTTPAMAGLIQRKANCACGGSCPQCQNEDVIQTKLAISTPGDQYEAEADHVAEQVMRMPDPQAEIHASPRHLQRACAGCESAAGKSTPAHFSEARALSGGGHPLSASARSYFEPRFGYDFSNVRLHTDNAAMESARQVKALAYTIGHDIVLGAGQTSSETPAGRRLLAHELTHVIQQGGGQRLGGSTPARSIQPRLSRMIQRAQTDAGYEAGSGVGAAITAGTMVPNNTIMGHTFTATNCRGLYGCNIDFAVGKAYTGVYTLPSNGRDVRGAYIKITPSFNSTICGTCSTVHIIQDIRNIRHNTAGAVENADPTYATRRTRSDWGNPSAPSPGWRIDRIDSATNPRYTSGWSGNPGTATTPAEMWDAPGEWSNARNAGLEFQSCAICENAGAQGRVIGCINWGLYIDSSGAVSFSPATPTATCGPSQQLQDATTRWEAIPGNQSANIDFTRETGVDQGSQRSVLWFQFDSTTLREDAEVHSSVIMEGALRRIRQHLVGLGASARIVVHGYASEEGDPGYNMGLSRRRAEAIRTQLIAAGIPSDRITIQPHGEDRTLPTRAWNRRVEIEHTMVQPGGAAP